MTFDIRRARPSDASEIASLYHEVYGGKYSLKEFTDPAYVRDHVNADQYVWFIARQNGVMVGSTVGTMDRENRSCELGRTAVKILSTGRGCANALCDAMKIGALEQEVDLLWGTMRNNPMLRIATKLGLSVVGYTGVHVPYLREVQLVGLELLETGKAKRVAPSRHPFADISRIEGSLPSAQGIYPAQKVVRPTEGTEVSVKGNYHAGDKCLQISDYDGQLVVPDCMRLTLLADKTDEVAQAIKVGFEPCAYLPGWLLQDGRRYDCIALEWYRSSPTVEEESFVSVLADLKRALALK